MLSRCTFSVLLLLMAAAVCAAEDSPDSHQETAGADAPLQLRLQHLAEPVPLDEREAPEERRWHIFFAAVNTYPRLESERLIDDLLEPVVKFIAPSFDDFHTVGDLRDQGLLWPPHIGIGYSLSKHWGIFLQGGYSSGKVRTDEDNPSILLGLPLHTDLEIKRGAAYLGIGVDYFPWKQPVRKKYDSWGARLKATKPFLGLRYTWTYATYDAKVRLQLRPFPNLGIRLDDSWLVPSVNVNAGLEVPINPRSVLFMNGGYAFFDRQREDFAGPVFTLGWKYFF